MTEQDGFRIEAALQFGFTQRSAHEGDEGVYSCTEAQLIAFAKSAERKGRAEASKLAQTSGHEYRVTGFSKVAAVLDVLAGSLDRLNAETDAELAPILAAEEERFMTSRGYVRVHKLKPGTRWVKP